MFKTDKWIRSMSKGANQALFSGDQLLVYLDEHHLLVDTTTTMAVNGNLFYRDVAVRDVDMSAFKPMIEDFVDHSVREVDGKKVISYGLSSMGYDVRLAKGLKVFTNVNNAIIDPKGLDPAAFIDKDDDVVIIPPNGFALGHTVETFNIPRDTLVVCLGKSTYARAGVAINITPIEPGFSGQVVIEIANTTNLPVKIYTGEGIAQFLFGQSDENCETSYGDRNGKYQNQRGIQLPLV